MEFTISSFTRKTSNSEAIRMEKITLCLFKLPRKKKDREEHRLTVDFLDSQMSRKFSTKLNQILKHLPRGSK